MAYITFDFGSSNSGAILNMASGKEYISSELIYVHRQDDMSGFTKQPTVFWINKELLSYSQIEEEDLNIYSCVFYEEEYAYAPNFIWCVNQVKNKIEELKKNSDWVCFRHPKMAIYTKGLSKSSSIFIKGSDGNNYELYKVLTIFFSVIKKECLFRARKAGAIVSEYDINWGITVPGLGIWHQEEIQKMRDCVENVFGTNLSLYSEPECALVGINITNNDELDFVENRISLVVDLGGGTADISVVKETKNDDGTITFDEMKATSGEKDATVSEKAGGNDIDNNFYVFFCNSLAKGQNNNDVPIEWLWNDFMQGNPKGAFEFNRNWQLLHYSSAINDDVVYFNPGMEYLRWLGLNYPNIARKSNFGSFSFAHAELYEYVFKPVYDVILKSLKNVLITLKKKNIRLDLVCFAGGLSLDVNLKKEIKNLVANNFKFVQFKEASEGATVGAVQRGGNHVAVNKNTLVRRMARRTYYVEFVLKYTGEKELREVLRNKMKCCYAELGEPISDADFDKAFANQKNRIYIDYSDDSVTYLRPICLKFAPISQPQRLCTTPYEDAQTGVTITVYSSIKNLQIFPGGDDLCEEGELNYEFGYAWKEAELVFDPTSNAVEGSALFSLNDSLHNNLKTFEINNVSKRGY